MLEEKIYLKVLFEKEKLTPAENGFLGEFKRGNFLLEYYILPEIIPKPICFTVNGTKDVISMKTDSKIIPISQDGNGVFTTQYASNNIRFAVFGGAGKFEIWEIAIVSQDGLFFLTEQKTYEAQWFRHEDNATCPDFEKWPQLLKVLKPIIEKQELPPVSEYRPKPAAESNGLAKGQGRVLYWNKATQVGLISLGNDVVARVHWKSLPLEMNGGLRKLEAGQLVSYRKLLPIPTNARSTTVNLEAKEVTVL